MEKDPKHSDMKLKLFLHWSKLIASNVVIFFASLLSSSFVGNFILVIVFIVFGTALGVRFRLTNREFFLWVHDFNSQRRGSRFAFLFPLTLLSASVLMILNAPTVVTWYSVSSLSLAAWTLLLVWSSAVLALCA